MSDTYQIRIGGGVDVSVISSVKDLQRAILDLTEGAKRGLEALGIGFGVEKLLEFGKGAVEAAVQMGHLSQQVGIGVEQLSKFKYAADLADVGEHFRQGMLKFSVALSETGDKSSKAAQLFHAIGVSAQDATGKLRPTEAVLFDVADKFKGWADGANKAAIAEQLFGTRNAQFISLLNEGSAGLREQGDALEKLGGVVKDADVRRAEDFDRSMKSLKASLQGLALALGSEILPTLTGLVKGLTDTGVAGGKLSPVFELLVGTFKYFSIGVVEAYGVLQIFGTIIGQTAAAATDVVTGNFSGARAIMKQLSADLDELQAKRYAAIDAQRNPVPGLVGAAERKGDLPSAPSISGNKAAQRDELEALREQVKLKEALAALDLEKVKTNFDLTDWEKRDLEVSILDQETKFLQQQIDLLKQKRALTDDDAARSGMDKEISALTDKQVGIGKQRQGITGGPGANDIGQQMRAATTQLRQQFGTVAQNIAEGFRNVIGSAVNSISNGITGLIMRTKTWSQALMEIGSSILTSVVQSIVQMGVKWIATQLLMAAAGKAIMASSTAATAPIAAAQSAIWATPATLATISSYGAAAAAAPEFIFAAEGVTMAGSLAAFDQGGYTGNMARSATAGIVHGQEYVLNAPATREYAPILDAMNRRELKLGGASGAQGGGNKGVNVQFVNDRQDQRQFQARDGWKITADALRKRGARIV